MHIHVSRPRFITAWLDNIRATISGVVVPGEVGILLHPLRKSQLNLLA